MKNLDKMPITKLGASVKEFLRIAEYASHFDSLEIDLEKASAQVPSMDPIVQLMAPYMDKVYSLHLRYKPAQGRSGIDATLEDMDLVKELGVERAVTHTDYPQSSEELEKQLSMISDKAAELSLYVAIENLCDRTNKTSGYMAPRNPNSIADFLERLDNKYIGLCLDTGHAISNLQLTNSMQWDANPIKKWLMHVHYNDNVLREDQHLPLSPETIGRNPLLIPRFKKLLTDCSKDFVIILENRKLAESIQSRDYLNSLEYQRILPSVL